MSNFIDSKFKFPIVIIILAIVSRLIPHAYNFAPFGAIALFGSAYFQDKKIAFIVPIIAAWISGVVLNNTVYASMHPTFILFDRDILWQSMAYVFTAVVGFYLYDKNVSPIKVVTGAVASSLLFFTITNFGFWVSGSFYPTTISGLVACFTAAIPFYQSTLMGDLIFSSLFFGSYYFAAKRKLNINHA